jgi:hypothetical protein
VLTWSRRSGLAANRILLTEIGGLNDDVLIGGPGTDTLKAATATTWRFRTNRLAPR